LRPLGRWTAAAAALLSSTTLSLADPTPPDLVATADFDFYVLTLSWSPGFCDTGGENKSPEQCDVGSGAGFVTHGLWPDNADRADPSECGLRPDFAPSEALKLGEKVYPTRALAIHEWREHGTCTGLEAEAYFRAVQYAHDEFTIPDQLKHPTERFSISPDEIEKQFISVNANLTADSMAVTCGRGELIDVRFCLTKDLRAFALCPKVAGHTCHAREISVSPVR
jgi:ribonuclease T2